jgi:hypothetical protein
MERVNRMKTIFYITVIMLFFTITILCSGQAEATSVIRLEFDEIIRRADTIVSGKVISITHKIIEEDDRRVPYTFVTIAINENLKGSARGNFHTIKLLGGPAPDQNLVLNVGGMPKFSIDQEVFLFLNDNPQMESPIVGFFQGRFNIQLDRSTGSKYLYDNFGNLVTEEIIFGPSARSPGYPVNYEMFRNYVSRKIRS